MKKNGFTLIELLAVIVILVLILAIALPAINNIIENARIETFIVDEEMMVMTAKMYTSSNPSYLPSNVGETKEIKLSELKEQKWIDEIKDPWNTDNSCGGYILITKIDSDSYDYNPYLRCDSNYKADSYLEDGLVVSYEFNNNAYDYTPNNHNGIINNAIGGTNRFGTEDYALEFQGPGNFVDTNYDYSFNYNTGTTITLWVNFSVNDTGGKIKNILGKNSWEYIFSQIDNKIVFIIWNSSGDYAARLTSNIDIITNTWYNLALVYNGSTKTFSLYVNGMFDTSEVTESVSFINRNEALKIGRGYPEDGAASSTFFIGNIDNINVYSRALSPHEIKLYYDVDMKTNK